MLLYQIKIQVKPYKPDEFLDSINSFIRTVRKEKGCIDFGVYRDSGKENTCILVGEWKTRQDMEKHFKTREFELLIGAARVLGEEFSMKIAEISKNGPAQSQSLADDGVNRRHTGHTALYQMNGFPDHGRLDSVRQIAR